MTSNEKKDKVQRAALEAWEKANKVGTCEIITGLGKTFIGLHALYTMPKNKDVHLFLAEATDRKTDLYNDIQKYNKIFKRDVLRDYNLKFYCYQSAYKWKDKKFGLVIADEIHDSLSPSYSQFYRYNKYKAIIGLSATINLSTKYTLPSGREVTKKDYMNKIAPICYRYKLKTAKEEGTSRKLNIYVISHQLDNTDKYVPGGSPKKRFYQTEKASYDYWDSRVKRAYYMPDITMEQKNKKDMMIRVTAKKRSDILYDMKSKVTAVQKLVDNLSSKTIIFGNSIDTLLKITPNVVSSRNSAEENLRIRNAFANNKIDLIGSFKKLKQGANLPGLDNCILMSYYGISKDLIQRIGRLRDNGMDGYVFIFVTQGTQEEVWFSKMMEEASTFNLIYCPDVEYCIKQINK
jgi:superfamily II DNA or RNA helicase